MRNDLKTETESGMSNEDRMMDEMKCKMKSQLKLSHFAFCCTKEVHRKMQNEMHNHSHNQVRNGLHEKILSKLFDSCTFFCENPHDPSKQCKFKLSDCLNGINLSNGLVSFMQCNVQSGMGEIEMECNVKCKVKREMWNAKCDAKLNLKWFVKRNRKGCIK